MIEWFFVLLISLFGLYRFCDYLVTELEKFAEYSKISGIAVGFIFLAVSTSIPELSISISSSILKVGELGLGTSLGNIVYDLLWILPLVAILCGLKVEGKIYIKMVKISLISIISLFPLLFIGKVNFIYGLTLILVFIIFSKYLLSEKESKKYKFYTRDEKFKNKVLLAVYLVSVVFFSYLVVHSSRIIVDDLGISAIWFGSVLVSFFSSSPELFSSLSAARRKKYDLVIGAIFGTVLFDSTFVPGVSMLFSSYLIEEQFYILYSFISIGLISILVFSNKGKKMSTREGIVLLALFSLYILLSSFFI